ncbi:MAG: phosphotransferase [Bacteroidales bacterium]|jgi:aminoglycoside/choline kinase family phosphotransferase|nr:phosphotransferase [Bacteroidales bacterium]
MTGEKAIRRLFNEWCGEEIKDIQPLNAHGSARKYYRVRGNEHCCLATFNAVRQENEAFISYAHQLAAHQINVPTIYGKDLSEGVYLQRDLGDVTLYSLLQHGDMAQEDIYKVYAKVISWLPRIQMSGRDFDYSLAYPRKAFDAQSIEWDLQYFKYYFLKMADIAFNEEDLEKDFKTLTSFLLTADNSYFLYRDFQSRNIMLVEGEPYFIDFQGGRKGALQYDIASLLYDAKANLSPQMRERLLDTYISELETRVHTNVGRQDFRQLFYAFVYVRIMQAMGTYGYRGYFQRKEHFLLSIPYALENLKWLEENVELPLDMKELHRVFRLSITSPTLRQVASVKRKLTVRIKSFSYRKGYPHDVSGNGGGFVFDCRSLHNPGRYEEYKHLTGKDEAVIRFLEKEEGVHKFYSNVLALVNQSCEVYLQRNFTNFSVYFGCTGGQHRSVYMAERLAKELAQCSDYDIVLQHVEEIK